MQHVLHDLVVKELESRLHQRHVVVFFDPYRHFESFWEEIGESVGVGLGELPRFCIGDTLAYVIRFEGSFVAVKLRVEPLAALDKPEPLVIYIPGFTENSGGKLSGSRGRHTELWNVLLELCCAGVTYEPDLRRLAREPLRKLTSDAQVELMLTDATLTYLDVVGYLQQATTGNIDVGARLRLVFGNGGTLSTTELLGAWLRQPDKDADINARQAGDELSALVVARLGFQWPQGTALGSARYQTWRYVLVNEFRSDLGGDSPTCLDVVPKPATPEQVVSVREFATLLRKDDWDTYQRWADDIEKEFGLKTLPIIAENLGSIDTFRFEERALLTAAARTIGEGNEEAALRLVNDRKGSRWVDRDPVRQAQWRACQAIAELGVEVARVGALVKKAGNNPTEWISAYGDDWYRVDLAHRRAEGWVAQLPDTLDEPLERSLGKVRRDYEDLLETMAQGFCRSFAQQRWSVQGVMPQTHIYSDVVEPLPGKTAYFWVDAMRFEMARELMENLEDAQELRLTSAVGMLPSITPVGMAALLPGAGASFSVVQEGPGLAVRIEGSTMGTWEQRKRYLLAKKPDVQEVELGRLLDSPSGGMEKLAKSASLLIVRSQEIDALGETDGGQVARRLMAMVLGDLARAVRKLAKAGFEHFVITSDHGHLFSLRKDSPMLMDKPGGVTVDLHRRVWVGRGGATPQAAIRVLGAELGYDTDLEFLFPKGTAVFRAGGDLAFHHGGMSLQEMVIPVLYARFAAPNQESSGVDRVRLHGVPQRVTNRIFSVGIEYQGDLFSPPEAQVRLVLKSRDTEVGRAGLASGAEVEPETGILVLGRGKVAQVGMLLQDDTVKQVRILALHPDTDQLLAQSDDINVSLGI